MSATQQLPATGPAGEPPTPRVRHQARDAAVVMTFSAVVSITVAVALLLLTRLGN
ncbi:hypothetical protein GCM10023340_29650 [Nocardioides marinquilinus]|uniref:Uncharacterized protein n=1 Tax=Nocardioides marinquilinus TaxID=1210400 RepID=A0ABP9PS36_9ACTN